MVMKAGTDSFLSSSFKGIMKCSQAKSVEALKRESNIKNTQWLICLLAKGMPRLLQDFYSKIQIRNLFGNGS
jgi:hypothetical protein